MPFVSEIQKDTGAVRVIPNDNSLIHLGYGFNHSNVHSVANGANIDHLIVTPFDIDMHLRLWTVRVGGAPMTINAYEDTITSNNGTSEPVGNVNRQSTRTNKVLIYHTPTITSIGNNLESNFITGGGTGSHLTVGESAESPLEWLLKKNTKYLLRTTNSSGSTANVYVRLFWYEL